MLEEVKAGRGPIRMVTKEAFKDPHLETIGWENFLGMTIGQAVVWASQNIDPKHTNPELYNRMMTVDGLFGAGDTIGGTAHKFSSGSFAEGRIAAKAAVNYINDLGKDEPKASEEEWESLKETVFKPMAHYEEYRNEIVGGTVSPSYILPIQGLQRLEKIMDEYVGGISSHYTTNEPLLTRGLELLEMLKEDLACLGAEDLHQLQRAWELQHRVLASESVTHHTMFRKETRWPGYYYRADHPKLDDEDWHCFTLSQYDRESDKWSMEKAPVYHIID
jgi:adenylylsulfate reductase subunit A